jgi:hypothetical protein
MSSKNSIIGCNVLAENGGIYLHALTFAKSLGGEVDVKIEYKLSISGTYLVATYSTLIEVNGLPKSQPFVVLAAAQQNSIYDVRITPNNPLILPFETKVATPQKIYKHTALLSASLATICGEDTVSVFTKEPIQTGTILYANSGFSTVVSGFSYVVPNNGANVYNLNNITGVVGTSLPRPCAAVSKGAKLAALLVNICTSTPATVYIQGNVVEIGTILYNDAALSAPTTGFNFVVLENENVIYNIDTATGEILSLQGTNCTSQFSYYQLSKVKEGIEQQPVVPLFSTTNYGQGAEMYINSNLSTLATGFNFIMPLNSDVIRIIDKTTGIVGCKSVNC